MPWSRRTQEKHHNLPIKRLSRKRKQLETCLNCRVWCFQSYRLKQVVVIKSVQCGHSLAEEHVTNYWDTSPGLLFPEAPCLWPAWGFKMPIFAQNSAPVPNKHHVTVSLERSRSLHPQKRKLALSIYVKIISNMQMMLTQSIYYLWRVLSFILRQFSNTSRD